MNAQLRDRINRKLESLPDARAYQVLDFIEFMESKYAERQNPDNIFTRFADTVEDGLRAGKVSASTIGETMGLMNRAMGVLNGAMAAGKSVAADVVSAARQAGTAASPGAAGAPPRTTPAPQADGAPAAAPHQSAGNTQPLYQQKPQPQTPDGDTGEGTNQER